MQHLFNYLHICNLFYFQILTMTILVGGGICSIIFHKVIIETDFSTSFFNREKECPPPKENRRLSSIFNFKYYYKLFLEKLPSRSKDSATTSDEKKPLIENRTLNITTNPLDNEMKVIRRGPIDEDIEEEGSEVEDGIPGPSSGSGAKKKLSNSDIDEEPSGGSTTTGTNSIVTKNSSTKKSGSTWSRNKYRFDNVLTSKLDPDSESSNCPDGIISPDRIAMTWHDWFCEPQFYYVRSIYFLQSNN